MQNCDVTIQTRKLCATFSWPKRLKPCSYLITKPELNMAILSTRQDDGDLLVFPLNRRHYRLQNRLNVYAHNQENKGPLSIYFTFNISYVRGIAS